MLGLKITFPEPISGYWNGGPRTGGVFTPEAWSGDPYIGWVCAEEHPGPGKLIRWGSWELNFWFTTRSGRSWRQAAAYAERRLRQLCRVPCTVEIEEVA